MMRIQRAVVMGLVLVGAILAGFSITSVLRHRQEAQATSYYCPMHPTYTSERPGDCPICNMKLVKVEEPAPTATAGATHQHSGQDQASEPLATICYLHNCPKLHEGRPCPMTVVAKPGEPVICPICGTHVAEAATGPAKRKILYWTDPMIPGFRADGPGKSPMGMDLVPVYEEDIGSRVPQPIAAPVGYAPVLLAPQKQQLIGVTTAPIQRRVLTKTIRTVGIIAHDPELYQAQEEFIQAHRAWQRATAGTIPEVTGQARRLVESSRLRLRHLGLSEEMIDEVSEWEEPDHRLLLGGAGQLWVYASIYEYELSLVHQGQGATMEVNALPGRTFTGTVKAIDPMLDPMTRTTRVRILIEDPEGLLKPEMYVDVSIAVDLGEVLAVPREAVFSTGTHEIVFVERGQGLFEPRDVVLGVRADDYTEIKTGITEGERVVTSGNFLIDSESRLKGALEGLGGGEHQHGQ